MKTCKKCKRTYYGSICCHCEEPDDKGPINFESYAMQLTDNPTHAQISESDNSSSSNDSFSGGDGSFDGGGASGDL